MSEIIDDNWQRPKERLEYAGRTLAMGIVSIVLGFGLIGLLLAIATLSTSSRQAQAYRMNPYRYEARSYKQIRAGRICAVISLSLFGLAALVALVIRSMR